MKRRNLKIEGLCLEEEVPKQTSLYQSIPSTPQEIDDFIRTNSWIMRDVIRPYHGLQEDEDLFQEACIGVVKGISSYDPSKGVKLTTYVYTCAANEVKMSLRRGNAKKRSATVISIETVFLDPTEKDPKSLDIPDPKADVEHSACNNIIFSKIMNVVNTKLSIVERTTVVDFLEGIPQAKTAKALHISQGQVSKLYNQALQKIRSEID